MADRLQALLAAFEVGNTNEKYALFAELAMAALTSNDVTRK